MEKIGLYFLFSLLGLILIIACTNSNEPFGPPIWIKDTEKDRDLINYIAISTNLHEPFTNLGGIGSGWISHNVKGEYGSYGYSIMPTNTTGEYVELRWTNIQPTLDSGWTGVSWSRDFATTPTDLYANASRDKGEILVIHLKVCSYNDGVKYMNKSLGLSFTDNDSYEANFTTPMLPSYPNWTNLTIFLDDLTLTLTDQAKDAGKNVDDIMKNIKSIGFSGVEPLNIGDSGIFFIDDLKIVIYQDKRYMDPTE